MPRGAPSPKVAITVPPDVYEGVVAAASADGVSVSAWMSDAARRALKLREGLAAVAEYEAEFGTITDEEKAAARQRRQDRLTPKQPSKASKRRSA